MNTKTAGATQADLLSAEGILVAIDAAFAVAKKEQPRRYLGASAIGNRCEAALAYALRGFPDDRPEPFVARIFKLGHTVEEIVLKDLKAAGLNVIEVDPLTGRQFHYSMFNGHVRCNLDGLIELPNGEVRNLEIKSMNDASWTKFKDNGVKYSHPHYFDQMQMQMGLSGIKTTLFIAYNKNNSKYHAQIVEYDEMEWSYLQTKLETVLHNNAHKIAKDESDWRCRGCFKFSACWKNAPAPDDCAACAHACALPDGGWYCLRHGDHADKTCGDFQRYEPKPKE